MRGAARVGHVEEPGRDRAGAVGSEADDQPVADGVQVAGEPGDLQLAHDGRGGRVGQVDDPERIGLEEGDHVGEIADEAHAVDGLELPTEAAGAADHVEVAVGVEHEHLGEGRLVGGHRGLGDRRLGTVVSGTVVSGTVVSGTVVSGTVVAGTVVSGKVVGTEVSVPTTVVSGEGSTVAGGSSSTATAPFLGAAPAPATSTAGSAPKPASPSMGIGRPVATPPVAVEATRRLPSCSLMAKGPATMPGTEPDPVGRERRQIEAVEPGRARRRRRRRRTWRRRRPSRSRGWSRH